MAWAIEMFAKKQSILDYSGEDTFTEDDIVDVCNDLLPERSDIYFRNGTAKVQVDGEAEPDKLREAAAGWNGQLEEAAIKAVEKWVKSPQFDTTESYQLRKLFEAADNHFGYGVDNAVIVTGEYMNYLCTRIPNDMMTEAAEHPERFVVFTVTADE